MNLNQKMLATSVLVALTYNSNAAEIFIGGLNGTTNKPAVFASEEPAETSGKKFVSVSDDLVIRIPSVPGYVTSGIVRPLYYKIALKGGAKFVRIPTLICKTTGGTTTAAEITVGGAAGSTQVTFSVKSPLKITDTVNSAYCQLHVGLNAGDTGTTKTGYYTIADKTDKSISARLEYKDGLASATTSYTGKFITFAQTYGVVASNIGRGGSTAAAAKIDVKEASKKFTNSESTTTLALLGSISFTAVAATRQTQTAATPTRSTVLKTATITVTGPVNGANSLVFVGGASDCSTTPITVNAPTGSSATATLSSAAQIDALASPGYNVCMSLNGNNVMDAGQFTVALGGTPQSNWTPVFGSPIDIHNLTKNGSSFRVLNIPVPDANTPPITDQAFIRLYNPNSFETVVRGTLYAQTGSQIGSTVILSVPPSSSAMKANEVRILTAANLSTLFGGTWTGRARLLIDAEADQFFVQALMRGPSGILVNMSSETLAE